MKDHVLDRASDTMRRLTASIEEQSERILEFAEPVRQPVIQPAAVRTPHDHLMQRVARAITDRELTKLVKDILTAVAHDRRTLLPPEIKDYIKRVTNVQL